MSIAGPKLRSREKIVCGRHSERSEESGIKKGKQIRGFFVAFGSSE
jgi:hypothetical protein